MGQIIGRTAKPDACNLRSLSSFGTPAAGQLILVSTDNSAMQNGQGNFDAYVVGDGTTAATLLELKKIDDLYQYMDATLHKSKNLFDKSKAISGKYINRTTGAVASASGYYASDFIPVSENGLVIRVMFYGGAAIGGAVYNSSKAFVRDLGAPTSGVKKYTFVSGDAYIRFTISGNTNLNTSQVEEGTTQTDYEEYYAPYYTYILKNSVIPPMTTELTETDFYKTEIGRNILDNSQIKDGYYININNGVEVSQSGYSVTPFIPMNGKNVCCVYSINYGVAGGCAVYNSQKQFVRGYKVSWIISFVEGDAFVRFTIKTSDKNIACAAYYDQSPRYFPFSAYQEKNVIDTITIPSDIPLANCAFRGVETGKNKFNKDQVLRGFAFASTGGVTASTQDFALTDYIMVSKNGLCSNLQSGDTLYFCVFDANMNVLRASHGSSYTYVSGDAYIRFTFTYSQLSTLQIEEGSTPTEYEAYTEKQVISADVLPKTSMDINGLVPVLSEGKYFTDSIEILLPDKLYAVVGDTLQVFYQGFVKCVNIENYDVLISCSKGRQYHRYFEYTPTSSDVGETTFGVTIYDNNRNKLGTASCTLVTLAQPSAPLSEKKFMCIGDSLTANGVWVAEAYRRLTGSGGTPSGLNLGNITFGGSMTKDGAGYIGKSGWSWHDFVSNTRAAFRFTLSGSPSLSMGAVYTNNGHNYTIIEIIDNTILCSTDSTSNTPTSSGTLTKVSGNGDATLSFSSAVADAANPFWDGSKVAFTSYVNTYLDGNVDYVYTLLSWNGMQGTISSIMADVKTFADALHRDYPDAKLRLMGLQFPSMKLMMPTYGASGSGYADTYWLYIKAIELQEAFQEFANSAGYSTWVEFVNLAAEFDSEYNMPITEKNVNTRNSTYQEPYANNGVHPSNAGYLQIGDVAYRSIVNDLSEA